MKGRRQREEGKAKDIKRGKTVEKSGGQRGKERRRKREKDE